MSSLKNKIRISVIYSIEWYSNYKIIGSSPILQYLLFTDTVYVNKIKNRDNYNSQILLWYTDIEFEMSHLSVLDDVVKQKGWPFVVIKGVLPENLLFILQDQYFLNETVKTLQFSVA